jgi:hypothetical protein
MPDAKNTKKAPDSISWVSTLLSVIVSILLFMYSLGASMLSYAKYKSIGWAILDFFFAFIYYPYYAFFLNQPTTTMVGGMMRKLR